MPRQTSHEKAIDEFGISIWQMLNYAKAKEYAERLEANRKSYYAGLYADIQCSHFGFGHEYETGEKVTDVSQQALIIIDKKAAYERRINKLKRQHIEWLIFQDQLKEKDKHLLSEHFEKHNDVPAEQLQMLLFRCRSYMKDLDHTQSKSLDHAAKEDFKLYMANRRASGEVEYKKDYSYSGRM